VNITLKKFSLEMIEGCPQAKEWLGQFPKDRRGTATNLLLNLQFLTRDTYSEWLKTTLWDLRDGPCALYAVRKFDRGISCLWNPAGEVVGRPSSSLGSEDLVHSVISGLIKADGQRFLDHPNLEELKIRKVKSIVLIDDSIGSGDRVSSYIKLMMSSKTFLSWWSFGWVRLNVVAFARTKGAEIRIVELAAGSNHPKRKFPKASKIGFLGHLAYEETDLSSRWGPNYQSIIDLCDSISSIPSIVRRGFGNTMANIVFYHSVPDNLPGVLWFQCSEWDALFPDRSVPKWLPVLLDCASSTQRQGSLSESFLTVLRLIKKGMRNEHSLARAMGLDAAVLRQILVRGRDSGLLTKGNRLTKAGSQRVWAEKQESDIDQFDRSLYVPSRWCVGQGTVQPSGPEGETH
jgi:hypothetical protein